MLTCLEIRQYAPVHHNSIDNRTILQICSKTFLFLPARVLESFKSPGYSQGEQDFDV